MKLAFILPSNIKCAPNYVAYKLIEGLVSRGHDVEAFTFREASDERRLSFPCLTKKIRLSSDIDWGMYEIIHSMGIKPDFYVSKLILTRKLSKTKSVTTLHSDFDIDLYDLYGIRGIFYALAWWFFCYLSDARIFLNSHQLRRLPFYRYKKNFIVFNPTDKDNKRAPERPTSSTFLYCGAIRRIKGLDIVLEAMSLNNDFKLDIAGPAASVKYYNYCVNLVKEKGISKRINYLGSLDDTDSLYYRYNTLIVPSRSEGFGLVVLEALSRGLMVICSDIPSFKEVFHDQSVVFFKSDDPEHLAAVISAVSRQNINDS